MSDSDSDEPTIADPQVVMKYSEAGHAANSQYAYKMR